MNTSYFLLGQSENDRPEGNSVNREYKSSRNDFEGQTYNNNRGAGNYNRGNRLFVVE